MQLLEFAVDDGGGLITFEVDPADVPDDLVLAGGDGSPVVARARTTLEKALSELRPSLQRVAELLRELSPDEATLEFGLKMGGETSVIVAKGTAEANFQLSMTWRTTS
ncbi:CU044_2847 family protein [Nonomuraea jabiensis]|uniref:CU044_2847 family protein n=1 Tax=Nonomuraea jabiensis TaxID=882448 RepID=UPI00343A00BC